MNLTPEQKREILDAVESLCEDIAADERAIGYSEGYEKGRDEGYSEGYEKGRDEGYLEGYENYLDGQADR